MRTIAIASSKGGVGKTTTAINLGAALFKLGVEHVVIDCNITNPNVGLYLGAGHIPINLHSVLKGRHKLEDAIHLHHSGLKIIPGDIGLDAGVSIAPEVLFDYEHKIKKLSGVKILDCASGITKESIIPLGLADDAIIITTSEIPALTDALKTIQSAEKIGVNVCGIVLNRARGDSSQYIEKVREILGKPIIGVIPEDISVYHAQNLKSPVVHTHPKSKSAKAFHQLARSLL